MELLIGAFCLMVVLISSLVIYCVLSKPFDNSFEEAKANQKKILKQYQDQTKSNLEKARDKKMKKSAKKPKKSENEEEVTLTKEVSWISGENSFRLNLENCFISEGTIVYVHKSFKCPFTHFQ